MTTATLPPAPPSQYVFTTELLDPSLRADAPQRLSPPLTQPALPPAASLSTPKGKSLPAALSSERKCRSHVSAPAVATSDHLMLYVEVPVQPPLAKHGGGSCKKPTVALLGPTRVPFDSSYDEFLEIVAGAIKSTSECLRTDTFQWRNTQPKTSTLLPLFCEDGFSVMIQQTCSRCKGEDAPLVTLSMSAPDLPAEKFVSDTILFC